MVRFFILLVCTFLLTGFLLASSTIFASSSQRPRVHVAQINTAQSLQFAATTPSGSTGSVLGPYEVLYPTTVYGEPRESASRITRIEPGTRVNVVTVKGDWLEIRSKQGRPPGFIKKDSAKPIASASVFSAPGDVQNQILEPYEVLHSTTVYSEPRTDSSIVATIQGGTRINVVAFKGDWLEIRSRQGRPPGFIKKDSAKPMTSVGSAPQEATRGDRLSRLGQKKFPEECTAPTRAINPPGFKYELLDPKLAALYRRSQVSLSANIDQRWSRGYLLQQQGLIDEAYTILLDVLCEWPDAISKSMVLGFLAINREMAGDLEAAIWFYEKELESERMRGVSQLTGSYRVLELVRNAERYVMLGDKQKAKEKISEVEAILSGPQASEVMRSDPEAYLTLATLYVAIGDITGSRHILKKWEDLSRRRSTSQASRSSGEATPEERISLGFAALSAAYVEAGEYVEAKRFGKMALTLASPKTRLLTMLAASSSLAEVSIAERDGVTALNYLRQYEEAKSRYQEQIKAWAQKERSRALPEVRTLSAEFDRAMTESVDYTERASIAWLFGQAYSLAGQPREASNKFLEAVNLIENLRGFVGVKDRLAFFGRHTGPYHSLVDSLLSLKEAPEDPSLKGHEARGRSAAEIAFHYAEAARSRLLSEQIARSQAAGSERRIPDEVLTREKELFGKANAELRSGVPFEESAAYRDFQTFVERLRQTHPEYTALKYPIPVSASEVPLKDKEVLLAFTLIEKRIVVWVLQRGLKTQVFQIPVARERVVKAVKALRASLEPDNSGSLPPFDTRSSGDLFQWLLTEPLKSVPRGSRIIVVPDSVLGTIPFEILTIGRPDGTVEFVGHRYTFLYTPSATVFSYQRKFKSPDSSEAVKGKLLAVGDPVYDEGDPRMQKSNSLDKITFAAARTTALRNYSKERGLGMFSRLPGTNREIKEIASALGVSTQSPDIRLGMSANEYDLKILDLRAYRYIHFATHGLLAEDLPYLRQPALVLSQVGNLRGEDGFLTMEEVLDLRLRADLTVLSACQTGLGKEISGEGVAGLMRAFMYAGSRSVLVSLWRVEDESTAILMGKLYRNIAQGLPLAEALMRAKVDLRMERGGRFAHPFYWSAFVLFASE